MTDEPSEWDDYDQDQDDAEWERQQDEAQFRRELDRRKCGVEPVVVKLPAGIPEALADSNYETAFALSAIHEALQVEYEPGEYLVDEPDAQGHLFALRIVLPDADEDGTITIDDRDGAVTIEAAEYLERVADYLREAARLLRRARV